MRIKAIKKLLSETYYQGIYDGFDISRREHDKFFGDRAARIIWEQVQLHKAYSKYKMIFEQQKDKENGE